MEPDSIKKLVLEISGFIFYLYELYSFFHYPQKFSIYDGSSEIFHLRLVMLLLALPVLYLFRLAYFFDWEDTLSYFLSGVFKIDERNTFFQVKLFYYTIYTLLFVLLFLKTAEYIYKFFK